MKKKRIKFIAPIGEFPPPDKDLQARLKKLPKNASISDVFREISKWEPGAVRKFREMERTKKSGIIDADCCLTRIR